MWWVAMVNMASPTLSIGWTGRGDLGRKVLEWGAEDPTGPLSIHTGGLKYYKMLYVINVLCLGSLNPTTWR